jgi:hypothetical protein
MLAANANMVLSDFPNFGDPDLYHYNQDIRDNVLGGTAKRLNFKTSVQWFLTLPLIPAPPTFYDLIFRVKIKLGTWYLKKDILGSTVTWTNNSADFYEILLTNVNKNTNIINIAFTTPEIPTGTHSNNDFYIVLNEVISFVGTTISPSDYRAGIINGSMSLTYNSSANDEEETYFEYIARNSSSPINSYDLELPETNICEAFDISNPGNLYINNGTSVNPSNGQWRVEDTGSTYDFPMIRVRDVLTSQIKATAKYQGAIIGAMIYGHTSFDYSGKRYVLNGLSYTAQSETSTGEWIEIDYTRASFEEIQGATNQAGNGGEGQLRREIGDLTNRDNIGNNFVNSLIVQQQINSLDSDVSGTVTSLPVGTFSDEVREGDYLRILTPESGGNVVVRASADSTGTSVSIDSFTPPNTLPETSFVLFDLADIIERVRLGSIKTLRFSSNRTLEAFSQIVMAASDGIDITLPDVSESFRNNRSIEITVKNICSGSSDTINLKGGGADIENAGDTVIVIEQGHALTVFTDGTMWHIKSSFKHE